MNKKFNIKNLIKVSTVALAMIGGGVAMTNATNNNVHADSVLQRELANSEAEDKQDYIRTGREEDHAAYVAAKTHPTILANDLEYHPNWIKGHKQELINRLTPQQRKTIKQLMAFENGKSNYAPSTKDLGGNTPSSTESDKYAKEHTPVPKLPSIFNNKPAHKSRAINADKRAINNDKKLLSTRKAKRAINNYKRNHKANRYIKYLIQTNKDLTKRENHLTRLTKLTRKARATKRNAHRKSLKRVRKTNRKNKTKRNHKRITKCNRNHKHMKRNARKHTRRNLRHRK